jgi:hypothetical protein
VTDEVRHEIEREVRDKDERKRKEGTVSYRLSETFKRKS